MVTMLPWIILLYLCGIPLIWSRHHQCSSHHHTIIQGVNLFEQHAPYKNHPYSQKTDTLQRRSLLSQSQVSPIRISAYYDPDTFTSSLSSSNQTYIKHLIGAIADYYANAVSVVPVDGELRFDRSCGSNLGYVCGAYRSATCGLQLPPEHLSEQYMFDDNGTRTLLPSGVGISDTDLVLYVTANASSPHCDNEKTLAHAGPCYYDQFGRPLAGNMNICNLFWEDPTWHEDVEILLHEMTHVTIMSENLWSNFKNASGDTIPLSQVINTNIAPTEIITPTVITKVRQHFNCATAAGLALDVFGSSHWNERYVFSELMNAAKASTQTYYTEFTFAFLEDSGWYLVNYDYAETYAFGKGAGCAYFTGDCVDKGSHESNFPLYYCDGANDNGCNADYSNPSYCRYGSNASVPSEHQYFADSTHGGTVSSDYCPWRTPIIGRSTCWDTNSAQTADPTFVQIWESTSKCTTIVTNEGNGFGFCFNHTCNGWDGTQYSSVDIKVNETETISCTQAEESVLKTLSTFGLELKCPAIDIVCGTASNFGACYWGHYSDNEAKCICSPGFTGDDCNAVNDGIIGNITHAASKSPTVAPAAVESEVCFQDWDDSYSIFNGAWNKTGENYDLGIYTNAQNKLLSFKATEASWYIGETINPSSYYCLCRVSLYTDYIGDCSTNWVCFNGTQWLNYPQFKTYYGSCTNPAPTTPQPTATPTATPSVHPSAHPTVSPTASQSQPPTLSPSKFPTLFPTSSPSKYPTQTPTKAPSNFPTQTPTNPPSKVPTTNSPTNTPSQHPTNAPSRTPTQLPTVSPSQKPTTSPTITGATRYPSTTPTDSSISPSKHPSVTPTISPTEDPSHSPSLSPSNLPSSSPNTRAPTLFGETYAPTANPTDATSSPSTSPSSFPVSSVPTVSPSGNPINATYIIYTDPTQTTKEIVASAHRIELCFEMLLVCFVYVIFVL